MKFRVRQLIRLFLVAAGAALQLSHAAIASETRDLNVIPASAPRGARVLIVGLSGGDGPVDVRFASVGGGTVKATPLARTSFSVEVTVPSEAATGTVTVASDDGLIAATHFTLATDAPFLRVQTVDLAVARSSVTAVGVGLPSGRVFIADAANHRVLTISGTGEASVFAGTGKPGWSDGEAAASQFHSPKGVAYDSLRQVLYVADTLNHRIRRVTSDGGVSTLAGSGRPADEDGVGVVAAFRQPTGLALDSNGNLYVADTLNHKIRKVTPEGVVTTIAGTGRPSDRDGTALSAGFHEPSAIALLNDVTFLIADARNNVIRALANGHVTTVAGSRQPGFADGPAHTAQFHHPEGIAVSASGAVFVADTKNNRIRNINVAADGEAVVTTIAGTGATGHVDGTPLSAQFKHPSALTSKGALYVADSGNNALRIVEPEVRLSDVYPRRGALHGGTIRVFGAGFVPGQTTVRTSAGDVPTRYITSTMLLADLPAASAGTTDITVTVGDRAETLPAAYLYLAPPSITSIEPNRGSVSGDDAVTVRGSHFVAGETSVRFGDQQLAATSVTDALPVTPTTSLGTTLVGRTPASASGPVDVTVVTPAGTATVAHGFRYIAPPAVTGFAPATGRAGTVVTIAGSGFDSDPSGNTVHFGLVAAAVIAATETNLVTSVPLGAVTGPIVVTTSAGSARSATDFVVPVVTSIAVAPVTVEIEPEQTQTFTATVTWSDGSSSDAPELFLWSSSDPSVATADAEGLARGVASGEATITAQFEALIATAQLTVRTSEPLPPDPSMVATETDRTIAEPFAETTRFLYSGPTPIQTGVVPGTIERRRAAVIRGRVLTRTGAPLGGAVVRIVGHSEFGQTLSRADGMYDLAVNGGGRLVVRVEKSGYLPIERQPSVRWNDFSIVDDLALTRLDTEATTIVSGAATVQTARGSRVSDADGARQATLLFPAGTGATFVMPDGSTRSVATLSVRATEYTVGSDGANAMPAELPPASAYTYCVELSSDEAIAEGAVEVRFSKTVALYVENFLGFRVGGIVPSGYYDRQRGFWIAAPNGRVIRIVSTTGGIAQIDTTGDGVPESPGALAALGIDDAERRQLALLYSPNETLWRVPVAHFTPYDLNWPWGIPDDAVPPSVAAPGDDPDEFQITPPGPEPDLDDPVIKCGSIIECENGSVGETAPVTGTPWTLNLPQPPIRRSRNPFHACDEADGQRTAAGHQSCGA